MSFIGAGADWRIRNYLIDANEDGSAVQVFIYEPGVYQLDDPGNWDYVLTDLLAGAGGAGGGAHSAGSITPSGGGGGGGAARKRGQFVPADLVFPLTVTVGARGPSGAGGFGGAGLPGGAGGETKFANGGTTYSIAYPGGGGYGGLNAGNLAFGGGGGGQDGPGGDATSLDPGSGGLGGGGIGGDGVSPNGESVVGDNGGGGGVGRAFDSGTGGYAEDGGPGGPGGGGSVSANNAFASSGADGGINNYVPFAAPGGSPNSNGAPGIDPVDPPSNEDVEASPGNSGGGGGGSGSNVAGFNTGEAGDGGVSGRGAGGAGGGGVYASLTAHTGDGGLAGQGRAVFKFYRGSPPPPPPPPPPPAASATWNPSDKGANVTLSGSDLIATLASANGVVRCTQSRPATENRGFVLTLTSTGANVRFCPGLAKAAAGLTTYVGADVNGWGVYSVDGRSQNNGGSAAYTSAYGTPSIFFFKLNNGVFSTYRWNGSVWVSNGVLASGLTGDWFPAFSSGSSVAGTQVATIDTSGLTWPAPGPGTNPWTV